MAYIAENIDEVIKKANGTQHFGESRECLAAVKFFCKAPQTVLWRKGILVKGNLSIRQGTAIATFNSEGRYQGHAAIYVRQNAFGLIVLDQWNTQKFHSRPIRFIGGNGASNQGDKFYVVD